LSAASPRWDTYLGAYWLKRGNPDETLRLRRHRGRAGGVIRKRSAVDVDHVPSSPLAFNGAPSGRRTLL